LPKLPALEYIDLGANLLASPDCLQHLEQY